MESQKYNFETDYFTECPACGSVPKDDPRCVEYLQDGRVLYERYKLYGVHCEELRDIASYKLGKLMKYIIDNHLDKCTPLIQMIASLFPLTTENSSLMSKPNQLIPMKGKPVKASEQMSFVSGSNIPKTTMTMVDQFRRFGEPVKELGRLKDIMLSASTPAYEMDGIRNRIIQILSTQRKEIINTIRTTQEDVEGNKSIDPAIKWRKLTKFVYDFENDNLKDKDEYQRGVYFWIRDCYSDTLSRQPEIPQHDVKSLFVSLLCLKLHQLDPTGETNHDKQDLEPPTQPCRVFKYIDSIIPVKTTGVNYRNGRGAFCLEQTVYEVANVVLSLRDQLGIVGNKLIISQFADKTNDAQHQFDKFANFVDSQRGKGLTASEKSSVSVAATWPNFLRLLLAVLQDSSTDFDEFLESMIEDPPIDVIQDRINSLLGEDILEMVDGTDIKLFYKKQSSSFAVVKLTEWQHAELIVASDFITVSQGYMYDSRLIVASNRLQSIAKNMDVLSERQDLICDLLEYHKTKAQAIKIYLQSIVDQLIPEDIKRQAVDGWNDVVNVYNKFGDQTAKKIKQYIDIVDRQKQISNYADSEQTRQLCDEVFAFIRDDLGQGMRGWDYYLEWYAYGALLSYLRVQLRTYSRETKPEDYEFTMRDIYDLNIMNDTIQGNKQLKTEPLYYDLLDKFNKQLPKTEVLVCKYILYTCWSSAEEKRNQIPVLDAGVAWGNF